jgi:hypothetical protein
MQGLQEKNKIGLWNYKVLKCPSFLLVAMSIT